MRKDGWGVQSLIHEQEKLQKNIKVSFYLVSNQDELD